MITNPRMIDLEKIKSVYRMHAGKKIKVNKNILIANEWHRLFKPVREYKVNNIPVTIYELGIVNELPIIAGSWYNKDHAFTLINNTTAKAVTYDKVMKFLKNPVIMSLYTRSWKQGEFMCGDFAVLLHNRAERYGIRCAFVEIEYTENRSHAINAFDTTDAGIIFVDIGIPAIASFNYFFARRGKKPVKKDKHTKIAEGQDIHPHKLKRVVIKW